MSDFKCQSLFFANLPELQKLCAVKITVSPQEEGTAIRTAQRTMCRKFLLLHEDVLSSPVPGTLNQISVVMTIAFYKSGKFQAHTKKHGAIMGLPERVIPAVFQTCLSYTLVAKLAPSWNQASHLLIQGRNFLSQQGKQNAVVMDINVSDTQLCFSIEVCTVRLPPPELEDFNISGNTIKRFDNDKNAIIERHSILNNWCYVLPSMKMGQIITISHVIPSESTFSSYGDLQLHWENLYGCILPEDPQIYCSIYFKRIGEQLFTYPINCIRSQPVQYFPRVDLEGVLNAFIIDLKSIIPNICGFPLKMTGKALYATQDLTRSSLQNVTSKPANITGTRSCKVSLSQVIPTKSAFSSSACATEISHKMELKANQLKTDIIFSSFGLVAKDENIGLVVGKAPSRKLLKPEDSSVTLLSNSSLKVPNNSPLDSLKRCPPRIIPIFKGKFLQMDRQATKTIIEKKRQNTYQYSPKVVKADLAAFKPSTDLVNRSLHDTSLKNISSGNVFEIQIGKTNVKCTKRALKKKNENDGHLFNYVLAKKAVLDGNSTEIQSRKLNTSLSKSRDLCSNSKEIRKTAIQNAWPARSKKTHNYMCDSVVGNGQSQNISESKTKSSQ